MYDDVVQYLELLLMLSTQRRHQKWLHHMSEYCTKIRPSLLTCLVTEYLETGDIGVSVPRKRSLDKKKTEAES